MNWYKKSQTNEEWLEIKDSEAIDAVYYDEMLERLGIKLKTGAEYYYQDVPLQVYNDFLSSPNKEVFFNKYIRNEYK